MLVPFSFLSFVVLLFASYTDAATRGTDALYRGCSTAMNKLTFECPKGYKQNKCYCASIEYQATYADCVNRSEESEHDKIRALDTFANTICKSSNIDITIDDLQKALKNATTNKLFIDVANVTKGETLYQPVKLKNKVIYNTVESWKDGYKNNYLSNVYGGVLVAYWGLIIGLATFINLFQTIAPSYYYRINNKISRTWKQKVSLPALFGYSHSSPINRCWNIINMSVPTRLESLCILGYLILFFIFHFTSYHLFAENTRFPTYRQQLSRYLADRAGYMCMYQLPLVFLFAGRNNIMITATGWQFETFNAFHRWISRGMYIDAIIHAASYTVYEMAKGEFPDIYSEDYFIAWGLAAIVFGGIIMLFSHKYFRDRKHEIFLIFHWVFVSVFLVGVWWHLADNDDNQWTYACVAIWAFDRAARFFRIFLAGINSKADVKIYNNDVLKLKVDYSNIWSSKPGYHAYLSFLRLDSFWESHPFTFYRSPVSGEENKLVFCIRKRKGMTKRLAATMEAQPNHSKRIPVLIDGPYGCIYSLEKFQTAVLIAGGIGVTATFSYVERMKRSGSTKDQQVVFIWVIRTLNDIEWFRDEINYLLSDDNVDVQIFVTGSGQESDSSSLSDEKYEDKTETNSLQSLRSKISYGKPDLDVVIYEFIKNADSTIGFFTCGPGGMNDKARASVAKHLGAGKAAVEYFEESFAW
jgi:predicted ferric reductase